MQTSFFKKKIERAGVAIAASAAIGLFAYGQAKQATVLDGVYTEQQALDGEARYENICAPCHEGAEPEANPPKGSEFIEKWREAPVGFLYNFVRTSMPGDKPGTLSETDYINLTAYLLKANGYKSGAAPLSAGKTKDVLLVGPDGPKPLPPNALVSTAGCLVKNADGDWIVGFGTSPKRVRVTDQTSPEELAESAIAAKTGNITYVITNSEDFPTEKLKGHVVQAKGVLNGSGEKARIYVLSFHGLGQACN